MSCQDVRLCWDEVWVRLAVSLSERSVDPRTKVGCVIVSADNTQVLALGYNGNYAGGPNAVASDQPGKSEFLHAEENSLIKLDYNVQKRKIMYVTVSPCKMCAKRIVNAKIDEVVYREKYRSSDGLDILERVGIATRQYKQ
jgi:dCMP deaminase